MHIASLQKRYDSILYDWFALFGSALQAYRMIVFFPFASSNVRVPTHTHTRTFSGNFFVLLHFIILPKHLCMHTKG
jgi:hypothetical protein